MKQHALKMTIYFCCYCILLGFIAVFAFRRPHYNWDMLAYMALVLKMDHIDGKQIHENTYASAKALVPEKEFEYLLGSEHRKKLAGDADAFYSQLPFYAVKPFYTGLVFLFYKAGFSLVIATVLPSILCYLLIGFLLFYWLRDYLSPLVTLLSSALIMLSGFMVSMARESTPDCLSALLLLAAFYGILKKMPLTWISLFMALAIFARLDNIITALFTVSFLFVSKQSPVRVSLKQWMGTVLLFFAAYFCVTVFLSPFGWGPLFYPKFAASLNQNYQFHSAAFLKEYLALAWSKIITAIVYHHISLFFLLLLFIVSPWTGIRKLNFAQQFSLLLLLVILVRFILFPDLSDRFNIAFFLCGVVILISQQPVTGMIKAKQNT